MNLHEQYTTLLRRGMPEHPRLRWANNAAGYGDQEDWRALQKCEPWHGWVPPEMEPIEDDARDLITMHAAKWAQTVEAEPMMMAIPDDPSGGFPLYTGISRATYAELEAMAKIEGDRINSPAWTWPLPTLEAIITITAHLEPNNV
jgi:hypothetical protein